MFSSGADLQAALAGERYFISHKPAMRVVDGLWSTRPLLIHGPPGCGKGSLGSALAGALGTALVRLDCEPGMAPASAIYRWDTPRQLAAIEMATAAGMDTAAIEREIANESYLVKGPLLDAIDDAQPVTLLVTGLEQAEAGLRDLLAGFLREYAVEVPQVGHFRATRPPFVVLTSDDDAAGLNAIARQCTMVRLDYPAFDEELTAVLTVLPSAAPGLAAQVCNVVQQLRNAGLERPPGVGDTIAWTRRLTALGSGHLDNEALMATADTILPLRADRDRIGGSALFAFARPNLDRTG